MKFNLKKILLLITSIFVFCSLLIARFTIINFSNQTTKEIKESNLIINKSIDAEPQGDVSANAVNANVRFKHSEFSPTGIFVTKSSVIDIYVPKVEETADVYAFIGQWGNYKNLNDGKALSPERVTLNLGQRTIFQSKQDGMLYISNQSSDISINVIIKVANAIEVPTFIVNQTSSEKFKQELNKTNSPFIELVGKNIFGTFQVSLANQLWKNNLTAINKLNNTVKNWDKIYQMSNYVSGLSLDFDGVAKKHHNLIHIANPDTASGSGYASANNYFIRFPQATGAGKDLFTNASSSQWGLWHEIGHTYQNLDYLFDGFGEVTVNINSFWVQEEQGFRNRIFGDKNTIAAIKNHINSSNSNKSITDLNVWARLGVFLQLHMAYGKEFFPRINQEYRLLSAAEKPKNNGEKYQTFIKVASKTVNRNLIPFFAKWGIQANTETVKIVEKYSPLTVDIWNNIFDDNFESNAIIDYQLDKYNPVAGVKVQRNVLLHLNVGNQVTHGEAKKYLTNITNDMNIKAVTNINWNSINWNNQNNISSSGVIISQPNKMDNKYLIPTKISANNSVRILGLADKYKGIFGLNTTEQKLFISSTSYLLHSNFKNKRYIQVTITDDKDKVIYDVNVNGDETTEKLWELNQIKYQDNFKIKFWFTEPSRGWYYQDNKWNRVRDESVTNDITFKIFNNNLVRINNSI